MTISYFLQTAFISIALSANSVSANEVKVAQEAARSAAKSLVSQVQGEVTSAATRPVDAPIPKAGSVITDTGERVAVTAAGSIKYQGTALPEKNLVHGNMEAEARARLVDENFEASQVVKKGFLRSKEFDIRANAEFLDKARDAQKNPEDKIKWLTGQYTDCKQEGGEDIKDELFKTCDIYRGISDKSCHMGQLVEVDAKHKYECHQEREIKAKKCHRNLKVWCEKKHDCDSGGIVLKNIASDMAWTYKYPVLTLGTIADNYWSAACGKFTRSTKFEVKNKAAIDEFRIIVVGYDDYLRVSINGVQLYNEPGGGNILEIEKGRVVKSVEQQTQVGNAKGFSKYRYGHACELGRSNNIAVDIDLLPHLKEGSNELLIEVVVAGLGEGWIQVRTKQHCCIEQSKWEEVCP